MVDYFTDSSIGVWLAVFVPIVIVYSMLINLTSPFQEDLVDIVDLSYYLNLRIEKKFFGFLDINWQNVKINPLLWKVGKVNLAPKFILNS